MFTGLSAFPLTPLDERAIDEAAFAGLVRRLADARVDSITALGSTGSYAYLGRDERAGVARIAVENAGGTPVIVGIGALRTRQVLEHAEDAQNAGASAVLLAAVSYQQLTHDEVHGLFETVTRELSVPLVVYDNPGTTHFSFTDDLLQAVAKLPHVASIKIPGVPRDPVEAAQRVGRLRSVLPAQVSIGVSGDAHAAAGLAAGCQAWYSVIGGILPVTALELTRAAQTGDHERAAALAGHLQPLWELFARHGSLRVVAAVAQLLDLVRSPALPLPLRGLGSADAAEVAAVLTALDLPEAPPR